MARLIRGVATAGGVTLSVGKGFGCRRCVLAAPECIAALPPPARSHTSRTGGLHGCHFRSLDLDASCRSRRPDAHALPPSPARTHTASNRSRHTGSQGDGTVTARTWIRRKLPSVPAFRLPRSPGRTQRQGSRRSKVHRYPRSDGGRKTGWVCLCSSLLTERRKSARSAPACIRTPLGSFREFPTALHTTCT